MSARRSGSERAGLATRSVDIVFASQSFVFRDVTLRTCRQFAFFAFLCNSEDSALELINKVYLLKTRQSLETSSMSYFSFNSEPLN